MRGKGLWRQVLTCTALISSTSTVTRSTSGTLGLLAQCCMFDSFPRERPHRPFPAACSGDCWRSHCPESQAQLPQVCWWNTQWAYAGIRDPQQGSFALDKGHDDGNWIFKGDLSEVWGKLKEIPNVPIVTMAEDEKQLLVVDRNGGIPEQKSKYEKENLLRE